MKTQLARLLVLATAVVVFTIAAHAENGRHLPVLASNDNPAPDGNGQVAITITVTSTAAGSPVSLFASNDSVNFTSVGTITDSSWIPVTGRTKVAVGTIQWSIPNTGVTVTILAIQPGANGNPNKEASTKVTITPPSGCTGTCTGVGSPGL